MDGFGFAVRRGLACIAGVVRGVGRVHVSLWHGVYRVSPEACFSVEAAERRLGGTWVLGVWVLHGSSCKETLELPKVACDGRRES